jgi:ATP-dependent DNA helicase RecG
LIISSFLFAKKIPCNNKDMNWKDKALDILKESLTPIPHELSELDWKSNLSVKTDRLAQHICAFSNHQGGGMFAYGVNDDATFTVLTKEEIEKIVKHMGNIAHNNLSQAVDIDHAVLEYNGHPVLFVYVPEQREKPIFLRGKDYHESYCRANGQTRKMSELQVRNMIATSQGLSFEERIAKRDLTKNEVLQLLNFRKFFELLDKDTPKSVDSIMHRMAEYGFCIGEEDNWSITNLGAILFANNLNDFEGLSNRKVIVRKYVGTNNRNTLLEQFGQYGYAVGFEGLIDFIMKNVSIESIEVKRKDVAEYPQIAIREFTANALVHQDFGISGINLTIEIFSNRVVITNPGAPLNDVNRLIDLPPNSRNEKLAELMFLLGFCERRGSGIDRAVAAIEAMHLPAARIAKEEMCTRVTLFPHKELNDMTKEEKIEACYQHACLVNEDGMSMNNQSVRERFNLKKTQSSVASRIIADTQEAGLIKAANTDIVSKKFMTYVPYYA